MTLFACLVSACHGPADPGPLAAGAEFTDGRFLVTAWHEDYEEYFAELVSLASLDVPVVVLATPDQSIDDIDSALDRGGADLDAVEYTTLPMDTFWVRDYGPWGVTDAHGSHVLVDAVYETRPEDDLVPRELADRWGLPVVSIDLSIDGGNLLVDGDGRCITSEMTLAENSVSEDELRRVLAHSFGCEETVLVPALDRETTGHVDVFVAVNAPGEALVAYVPEESEPVNAALLDETARLLIAAGFRVTRVPMPSWSDDVFRSYLNVVVLDDLVLVPVFDTDHTAEADALAIIGAGYPGRQIVPVLADAIVELGGAVHCTTLSYPVGLRTNPSRRRG